TNGRIKVPCPGGKIIGEDAMALIIASSINTSTQNGYTLSNAGDELYVPFQISIYATNPSFLGVDGTNGNTVENHASILGSEGVLLPGAGTKSYLPNGTDGTISGWQTSGGPNTAAVSVVSYNQSGGGGGNIQNYGQILNPNGTGIASNGLSYIWNSG